MHVSPMERDPRDLAAFGLRSMEIRLRADRAMFCLPRAPRWRTGRSTDGYVFLHICTRTEICRYVDGNNNRFQGEDQPYQAKNDLFPPPNK